MSEDARWKQRLNNYMRALQILTEAVQLSEERDLSNLEEQGGMHCFEFTHELAWNVLKDYLEEQGISGIIGSKNAVREAFKNGLIDDGEVWMDMVKARNLSSHTYKQGTADEIVENILTRFYPAFEQMSRKFISLASHAENE